MLWGLREPSKPHFVRGDACDGRDVLGIMRRPADDGTALYIWETFVVVVKQLNICFTRLTNALI